jgi:hypothetical protein
MSEDNLVRLQNASIPKPQASADIVEMLEDVLERAKNGQVIGLAYVVVEPGRRFEMNYRAGHGIRHSLVAGVCALHHDMGKIVSEDGDA